MRGPAKPLAEILEKEWDATLFKASGRSAGVAVQLGWSSYHTLRSRGSSPGFPDRTLWKLRTLFAELKRELTGAKSEDANRRPSDRQRVVLDGLARAGSEVYVWRPSDLDEIARILGKPWRFEPFAAHEAGSSDFGAGWARLPRLSLDGEMSWVPRSIWIPGHGRADEAGA